MAEWASAKHATRSHVSAACSHATGARYEHPARHPCGLTGTQALHARRAGGAQAIIHDIIYKSIGYKNMGGIRLEVKGRLTKRYRADRSVYSLK